jgi:hypothetical protein
MQRRHWPCGALFTSVDFAGAIKVKTGVIDIFIYIFIGTSEKLFTKRFDEYADITAIWEVWIPITAHLRRELTFSKGLGYSIVVSS